MKSIRLKAGSLNGCRVCRLGTSKVMGEYLGTWHKRPAAVCACLNNAATDELLETTDGPYAEKEKATVEADSNLANVGEIDLL